MPPEKLSRKILTLAKNMELVRSGASIHILDISRPQRISRGRLCCDVPDVLYDADRPGALIGAAAPCLRSNPREGKKNSLSVAAEPKIASPSTQDPYRQPTYSLANRVGRQLWNICYVLLFRTSPTPFFAWRAWLLRLFGAKLGPTCRFYPRCRVWAPWNLICEDVVAVANDAELYNPSPFFMGSHMIVSQGAYICGATHLYNEPSFKEVSFPMRFGVYSWICARAAVNPGVNVGEGAILALGSVATKDLEPFGIYGGVPARKIKERLRSAVPGSEP